MKRFLSELLRCVVVTLMGVAFATVSRGESKSGAGLTVATAASARPALEEVARNFTAATGIPVTLVTGSSGLLARQIREGAPYDLFASADMQRVEELARDNFLEQQSVVPYARGFLVLWQRADSAVTLHSLDDLSSPSAARLRLAVAQPVHAPYGAAARQALIATGKWKGVEKRLVYGEDVGQVLQMAATGNVDAAFVPLSLATVRKEGSWFEVPEHLYAPLLQGVGLVTSSPDKEKARQFHRFLTGASGRQVLKRHGYRQPRQTRAATPDAACRRGGKARAMACCPLDVGPGSRGHRTPWVARRRESAKVRPFDATSFAVALQSWGSTAVQSWTKTRFLPEWGWTGARCGFR